jgi:hypothetical protein
MSAKGFEIAQYIPLMHYFEQKMAVGLLYSWSCKRSWRVKAME